MRKVSKIWAVFCILFTCFFLTSTLLSQTKRNYNQSPSVTRSTINRSTPSRSITKSKKPAVKSTNNAGIARLEKQIAALEKRIKLLEEKIPNLFEDVK